MTSQLKGFLLSSKRVLAISKIALFAFVFSWAPVEAQDTSLESSVSKPPSVLIDTESNLRASQPFSGASNGGVRISLPEIAPVATIRPGLPFSLHGQPVGVHRDIPRELRGDLASSMYWVEQLDGRLLGTLSITSPGSQAFRVRLRVDAPQNVELRYFAIAEGGGSQFVHETEIRRPYAQAAAQSITVWSPTIESNRAGIEVMLPNSDGLAEFELRLERVSVQAGVDSLFPQNAVLQAASSGQCLNHVDALCSASPAALNKVGAVARVLVEKDGQPVFCSGTLVNSRSAPSDSLSLGDGPKPYFVTSSHCVASQDEADSMEFTWYYQRAQCGDDRIDHRAVTTFGGADLLATDIEQGSSLLRIRQALPGGLVYSGWLASPLALPAEASAIHHPRGGVKKFATGQATSGTGDGDRTDLIEVDWDSGGMETGSGGSGLFVNEYLVGVLSGRGSDCAAGSGNFAAFESFYPKIAGFMQGDHADAPDMATEILLPATIHESLSAGDVDYFQFELSSSTVVVIHSEGSTDTRASLSRADAPDTLIASDDDGALGANFLISADLEPGLHLLRVEGGTASASGSYVLGADFEGGRPPAAAPTNVRVEQGEGRLTVSWDIVPQTDETASPATGYTAIAENSQGAYESCSTLSHRRSCTITGLQAGVEYEIYVRATNAFGSGPESEPIVARIEASEPTQPATLDVRVFFDSTNEAINVLWEPLTEGLGGDAEVTYRAEAREVDGDRVLACEAAHPVNYCTITGFTDTDTEYSLTVHAVNLTVSIARSAVIQVLSAHWYDILLDHGSWGTAREVAPRSATQGWASGFHDDDWFKVTVEERGTLYVWTTGVTDMGWWSLRTLSESVDYKLGSFGSTGENFWGYAPVSPDTYYFKVNGNLAQDVAEGRYTLHVELVVDDHGDDYESATTVGATSVTGGYLVHDDVDWFKVIDIPASRYGDTVLFWTEGPAFPSVPPQVNTLANMMANAGDLVLWADWASVDNIQPGTTYFAVGMYNEAECQVLGMSCPFIGEYTVRFEHIVDDHGDDEANATEVAPGQSVNGIVPTGDVDVFRVRATINQGSSLHYLLVGSEGVDDREGYVGGCPTNAEFPLTPCTVDRYVYVSQLPSIVDRTLDYVSLYDGERVEPSTYTLSSVVRIIP